MEGSRLKGEVTSHRKVIIISVNDTLNPKTGGEYVYKIMKDELLKKGYKVYEFSVPILLECLIKKKDEDTRWKNLYRLLLHIRGVFESILKRFPNRHLVLTSSHPAFPVFGHLVYHQPKAGMRCSIGKEYLNLYRKIGWIIVENEKLSPVWLLAKRAHILHLSNSFFTKRLIKDIYGLDSFVLYPPTPVSSILNIDYKGKRKFGIIVARPNIPSGITLLPYIVERLPKTLRIVIIGRADSKGLKVIQTLKRKGFNIDYLGYVSEQSKIKLFSTFSHYLHLSLNEPFGITPIEAMAAGCIPIAPKSGGIPEYMPPDLLYSSSSEAAEKIISKIGLEDPYLKIKLKRIASRFTEEKFRAKFIAYVRMLENLLF